MGKVILCYGKKAKTPYVINSTGVKLYTIEELCSYIGRNVSLMNEDDLHRGLCHFLSDELELKERAEYIEHLFNVGATYKDILVGLLCSCDYYDADEVDRILEEFDTFNALPVVGRMRLRADRLMKEEKYNEALAIYKAILSGDESRDLGPAEYGNVLHNIAVLQVRQGIYLVAADTFLEAYKRNGDRESLKQYLFALKLSKQEEKFSLERARLVEDRNLYTEINRIYDNVSMESAMTPAMDDLNELKDLREAGRYQEFEDELEALIEDLKREYRSCLS